MRASLSAGFPGFVAALMGLSCFAHAQDSWTSAVRLAHEYRVDSGITYLVANNYQATLDVYHPVVPGRPTPVLIDIHGGGWVGGGRAEDLLGLIPYMQLGFAVVSVDYRLAQVSLAPAAVEDCQCALKWVARNAGKFNFDLSRVVIEGESAGGHLALATAFLPPSAGFGNLCTDDSETPEYKVRAVINWYGITDVDELLHGPNTRGFALSWFGSLPGRDEIARQISPLTYVRPGLPSVLTIHGDADPLVPYAQAVRLHHALTGAGVDNQLLTIQAGGHGNFSDSQQIEAYAAIRAFLVKQNILPDYASGNKTP